MEKKAAPKTWDDDTRTIVCTRCVLPSDRNPFRKKGTLGCTIWTPHYKFYLRIGASGDLIQHMPAVKRHACEEESVVSITKYVSESISTAPVLLALGRTLTNIDQSVLFCVVGRLPERASSVFIPRDFRRREPLKPCFLKCSV